eukprot:2373049-Pleurochrysis_carterae.AAC.9
MPFCNPQHFSWKIARHSAKRELRPSERSVASSTPFEACANSFVELRRAPARCASSTCACALKGS